MCVWEGVLEPYIVVRHKEVDLLVRGVQSLARHNIAIISRPLYNLYM